MDLLSNLSRPVKTALAALSGACVIGIAILVDPRTIPFILIGTLVVLLVLVGYLVFMRVLKRRRSEAMGGSLAQHSAAAPRGVSDPARLARLNDLRINFQKGLARFRAAGKDLYSLPWFLVVGEPGSGKTEAIRNCHVGFPTGLQDKLQGAGGTLNMHWWFTNHAVMIDTAGRLMFEEVPPGSTSEWGEFLQLLRRSRCHCPVNGLILVIPSDSLIKDSAEEIAQKAGRIAEQLNTIQSRLDVRFPVFICVTKCDLIHGFREFFNPLEDPHLQHQILGWSNPDALDQSFRPELLEEHFEGVLQRLRRRRLGMLQDPTPQESTGGRRLDEVDALFSLPLSMAQLAPQLQRYLEVIFGQSEWSGQPLFLRGIYFASAMREGSALDRELADAIGVPVESLPEGKAWERERAFFLRDIFTEKIFKERGLVTRASNTRRLLWQRQMILLGGGIAGLMLVLGFSWLGARSLRESVGKERDFWLAAKAGWVNGMWRPIVSPQLRGSTTFDFNGAQAVKVGAVEMNLAEYHRRLAEIVQTDLRVPLIFGPAKTLGSSTNADRRRGQRILFETGVVLPLIRAAREKLIQGREPWTPASAEVLAYLVRLEGMTQNRSSGLAADELSAAALLAPLGSFLYGVARPDPELTATFELMYLKRKDARESWPPAWLSAGGSLTSNQPIAIGLNRFLADLQEKQKTQSAGLTAIRNLRDELRGLRRAEEDLARLASTPAINDAEFARGIETALNVAVRQQAVVDRFLLPGMAIGGEAPPLRLITAHENAVHQSKTHAEKAIRLLRDELDRFPVGNSGGDENAGASTLGTDIRRALIRLQQDLKSTADGEFSPEELAEMQSLDVRFLMPTAGEMPLRVRGAVYRALSAQWRDDPAKGAPVIGVLAARLARVREEAKSVAERARHYQGPFQREFGIVVQRSAELAGAARMQALFTRGLEEIEIPLERKVGFPLVRGGSGLPMTLAAVRETSALLRMARTDLAVMRGAAPPASLLARITTLETRVARVGLVADALLAEDRGVADVAVTLLRFEEQIPRLAVQTGNARSREWFMGDYWSLLRLGGKTVNTSESRNLELGRFPLAGADLRIDLFRYPDDVSRHRIDRTLSLDEPWSPVILLHQPSTRRLAGGREWEVTLSLSDASGSKRHLILLLEFDRPLPELEKWPSVARTALLTTDTQAK